ncbi:beta-xylosidase [Bifidobacterium cuniculi]|uniref:Beta-xylosidase n=1 Tax=Bifidobacterium cuniculi TaxID=1688 RepID=A0A087AWV5_9BIFI|nr:beta-xylosidase [Bifidobacterium cuniculi]
MRDDAAQPVQLVVPEFAWDNLIAEGPNTQVHDEDGNLIYVFHAAEYENGRYGGRDVQVRRVHWAADGMPVMDMQADEELDPACRQVTMSIVVR